jgi:hypothetical protein
MTRHGGLVAAAAANQLPLQVRVAREDSEGTMLLPPHLSCMCTMCCCMQIAVALYLCIRCCCHSQHKGNGPADQQGPTHERGHPECEPWQLQPPCCVACFCAQETLLGVGAGPMLGRSKHERITRSCTVQ